MTNWTLKFQVEISQNLSSSMKRDSSSLLKIPSFDSYGIESNKSENWRCLIIKLCWDSLRYQDYSWSKSTNVARYGSTPQWSGAEDGWMMEMTSRGKRRKFISNIFYIYNSIVSDSLAFFTNIFHSRLSCSMVRSNHANHEANHGNVKMNFPQFWQFNGKIGMKFTVFSFFHVGWVGELNSNLDDDSEVRLNWIVQLLTVMDWAKWKKFQILRF